MLRILRIELRNARLLIWSALFLVAFIILQAVMLESGYATTTQIELDRAVHAAALAGAASLNEGVDRATDRVVEYLVRNPVGSNKPKLHEAEVDEAKSQFVDLHRGKLQIVAGHWDKDEETFEPRTDSPNAIKVVLVITHEPPMLVRVFGRESYVIRSESVAICKSADLMLAGNYRLN